MSDKAYDVVLHHQFKVIGYQWGPDWGGVVNAPNGHDVVGVVRKSQTGDFYLDASQPWHTGKKWDGERVSVDNRPSKKFDI